MIDINQFLDDTFGFIGVKLDAFMAGIFGGIAAMPSDTKLSFRRGCSLIFSGALCAGYFTPLTANYFKLSTEFAGAISFIFGLIGMRIVGGLIKLADKFNYDPIAFSLSILDFIKTFIKNKLK